MADRFDVFLSYSRRDAGDWSRVLAENLERLGVRVWWDGWEVQPGDVLVHELDRGIQDSLNGIVVVSPAALESVWVQQEYAALMQRAIEGRRRIVPVLYADADLPPLLASRVWVNFRGADGPEYEARVRELADLLREVRPSRPPRSEELAPPPGTAYRPDGPLRRRLVLGSEEVRLEGGAEVAGGRPIGIDHAAEEALWNLRRAQRCLGVIVRAATAEPPPAESLLHHRLLDAGTALARCWLPRPVAVALAGVITEAERLGAPLELALDVADPDLARLPWETLRPPGRDGLPGEPLVLHSNVNAYRVAAGDRPTAAIQVPPPLRVLVAIGSPEVDAASGELLDYEAELSLILDAVEPARQSDRGAYVRLLRRGTPQAIREALLQQRFHVLYVSCHAGPGVLRLEDDEGNEERVDADRLVAEVLPPGRRPPLVVLAGCATAVGRRGASETALGAEASGPNGPGEAAGASLATGAEGTASEEAAAAAGGARHLPGLAEALLARGVPAVVAMQAPVGDLYARELGARLFAVLASHESPDPLTALSAARRAIEERRREDDLDEGQLAEWATPALYLPSRPPTTKPAQALFATGAARETIEEPPEPRLADGTVLRGVGDFVGRRREERLALRALRHDGRGGVLLQGLGGIGKSTLAAELTRHLAEDGWMLASVVGPTGPDDLLAAVAAELRQYARAQKLDDKHPFRSLASDLLRRDLDWEERFEDLSRTALAKRPLLLLLDNFEDNLEADGQRWRPRNADLAELLARWLRDPGKSRLLLTSRRPFALPRDAERRLEALHLGPLSFAETRKLLWRLPALHALEPDEKLRAYTAVGGHPRTLEYLDALLRGGEARYADVEERMERAIAERGVPDPRGWLAGFMGDLDAALAETVTLATDDVLLRDLLRQIEHMPLARRLLIGASVVRLPVDGVGLGWQVGEVVEPPADPERDARLAELGRRTAEARRSGSGTATEELGYGEVEIRQLHADLEAARRPPLAVPQDIEPAARRLLDLGLLSPAGGGESPGGARYLVHRWTATALADLAGAEELREAHRRAAAHWRWRVDAAPQSRAADVEQLLEARYHHHQAGDVDGAVDATGQACLQLDTWGAYRQEEQLCLEILDWVDPRSRHAAIFLHQLGMVAQTRGDYDEAFGWYRKSLEIDEELGNRTGMAGSYHQLGRIAEDHGDYDEALDWYRKSLEITEELGNRAGMATSYHHLGRIAEERGAHDEALGWYRKSLEIEEELGNRAGMASSYHQLGMVAQKHGAYDEALGWYRKSLEIKEELGNRAGMAISYHQLGRIAEERGDYDEALDWYRKSLEINEELGNRAGMASTFSQIGILWTEQGAPEKGLPLNLRSLALRLDLRVPQVRINLHWLVRQRDLLGDERFRALVEQEVGEAMAKVLAMMADFEAARAETAGEAGEAPETSTAG
jgi:tetratricopeptide (TPR) repeat protein